MSDRHLARAGGRTTRGSFVVDTQSARGVRRSAHARTVVMATGAFDFANLIGVPGEDLPHVSHYYTEPHPFFRKRVVIVGGKNSAAEAALDLYRAGAHVTIVHRRAALGESIKYWVKPDIENRIKEGSIAARFDTRVVEIRPTNVLVEDQAGEREELPADAVFLLTGYGCRHDAAGSAGWRSTRSPAARVRRRDVRDERAGTVSWPARSWPGMQSGKIFIENGRFHGEQVIERHCEGARTVASRAGIQDRETVDSAISDSRLVDSVFRRPSRGADTITFISSSSISDRQRATQAVALEQRLLFDRLELEILRQRVDQILVGHRRRHLRIDAAPFGLRHQQRFEPAALARGSIAAVRLGRSPPASARPRATR